MRLLALILLILLVGCATPEPESPAPPEVELTDAEVKAVVAVMRETEQISQRWRQRLDHVETEAELEAQGEMYRAEMREAVEARGFTIEEYRRIADAARHDPALAQRIEQALEEANETRQE